MRIWEINGRIVGDNGTTPGEDLGPSYVWTPFLVEPFDGQAEYKLLEGAQCMITTETVTITEVVRGE